VKRLISLGILACTAVSAAARPAEVRSASITEKAAHLGHGQYVWQPAAASTGPLFIVIELTTQRVMVYRDGVPIGASTISTGIKGRETPTGTFTVLQKEVVHRSSTYDDAPMPYMQRLTEKGIAMHAGHLPGYPASHGCIRLPSAFAKLLFGATSIGTPVMITDARNVAEQEQVAAEYRLATAEFLQRKAAQEAAAERVLANYDRARAAHEKVLRRHRAEMAKLQFR
jgi:hypothetical protein